MSSARYTRAYDVALEATELDPGLPEGTAASQLVELGFANGFFAGWIAAQVSDSVTDNN